MSLCRGARDETCLSPSPLLTGQISAVTKFLQSSSLYDSSSLSHVAKPLLLVDIKSLKTDTEVGFKGESVKFPPACVSKSSSSSVLMSPVFGTAVWCCLPESRGAEEGGVTFCLSLQLFLHYGYRLSFSEG